MAAFRDDDASEENLLEMSGEGARNRRKTLNADIYMCSECPRMLHPNAPAGQFLESDIAYRRCDHAFCAVGGLVRFFLAAQISVVEIASIICIIRYDCAP